MNKEKAAMIGKILSGNLSREERLKADEWLQDPSNKAEYERLKKIWELAGEHKIETESDVDQAWNEFRQIIISEPDLSKPSVIQMFTSFQPLKIAAAIALLISLVFVARFIISDSNSMENIVAVKQEIPVSEPVVPETWTVDTLTDTTSVSEPAETKTSRPRRRKETTPMITISTGDSAGIYTLPDNSIVYLNVNSKLSYPEKFSKTERRVILEGEGYFEVAHNEAWAFTVLCHNSLTRVLGTSFNIKGYTSEVEVTVLTGLVEFRPDRPDSETPKILLAAGDIGIFYPEKNSFSTFKNTKKDKDYKWWKNGNLFKKLKKFFSRIKGKQN